MGSCGLVVLMVMFAVCSFGDLRFRHPGVVGHFVHRNIGVCAVLPALVCKHNATRLVCRSCRLLECTLFTHRIHGTAKCVAAGDGAVPLAQRLRTHINLPNLPYTTPPTRSLPRALYISCSFGYVMRCTSGGM